MDSSHFMVINSLICWPKGNIAFLTRFMEKRVLSFLACRKLCFIHKPCICISQFLDHRKQTTYISMDVWKFVPSANITGSRDLEHFFFDHLHIKLIGADLILILGNATLHLFEIGFRCVVYMQRITFYQIVTVTLHSI